MEFKRCVGWVMWQEGSRWKEGNAGRKGRVHVWGRQMWVWVVASMEWQELSHKGRVAGAGVGKVCAVHVEVCGVNRVRGGKGAG